MQFVRRVLSLFLLLASMAASTACPDTHRADVVVYGRTPGGITAAIQGARCAD